MKKVIVEKYEEVDGKLFDSALEADEYEANLLRYGVCITQAVVSREVAKLYAIHQMTRNVIKNVEKLGTAKRAYGLCEVEELLDLIYGYTRNQKVVKVEYMIEELK